MLENVIIGAIFLIIGNIIGHLNNGYWNKNSKFKKLIIEKIFTSHVIYVDKDIVNDIEISYKDKQINQIYNFIFTIKNIGNAPIGNITKPLTFKIPEGLVLEKCSITKEEEKEINYNVTDNNEIIFNFNHLNEEEEFTIDLVLIDFKSSSETTPNFQELVFVINAEGLKDTKFKINYNTDLDFTIKPFIKVFYKLAFLKPVFITLLGFLRILFNTVWIVLLLLLYRIGMDNESLNIFNLSLFFGNFSLWSAFILFCCGITLMVIIFTIISYFKEISKLGKKKVN